MKASQFSDAQRAFILKQGDEGVSVAEICRKAGISQATYFNWKKKYAGMLPPEMKKLKHIDDENARLKRIVADLTLHRTMSGPRTSFTTNSRPARNCGCSRWSTPSRTMCRCLIHVTAIEVKMSCRNGYAGKLAIRRRSVSIRELRSCLAILTFGPTPKASLWTSHAPANRPTMRSLKRPMAASAPNV